MISRIVNSIRTRGFLGSLDSVVTITMDHLFDYRYGTQTMAEAQTGRMSIKEGNRADGFRYVVSRVRPLKKLLGELRLADKGAFVDFGCGKGRVLLLAAQCGFSRVTGVEYTEELSALARSNVSRFLSRCPDVHAEINVVEGDAGAYAVDDRDAVFYFFNPFGPPVMEKIMRNIEASLEQAPRRIYIIYALPRFRTTIDSRAAFRVFGEYRYWDTSFLVYTNRLNEQ